VTGQTVRGLYEQLVKQNSRLNDIEQELRRLQAMEMRQDKMCNQIGAMVEMFTRWSDQITKLTNQATGCNTNLLRLLALFERMKKG
jgi:archaellum component FlaC